MGGFTSKTEQDLKIYLEKDYDIDNYPFIVSRNNNKKVFVHQLITDSRQQADRIRHDVNLYKHLKCKSISNVIEYIPLESSKICSDQEYHYILEQRQNLYDLKQQFYARKYYKETFSTQQLITILKTYLCGLQVFHKQFSRNLRGHLTLDSIKIDQSNRFHLRMTDPFLIQFSGSNLSDSNASEFPPLSVQQKGMNFESPQRLQQRKTKFNENRVQLNQFLADIYVTAVLIIQLYRMQMFEEKITHQGLFHQVQKIKDSELKNILNLMISLKPEERGKVYSCLQVSVSEQYCLERTLRKGKQQKNQVLSTVPPININQKENPLQNINNQNLYSFKQQNPKVQIINNQSIGYMVNPSLANPQRRNFASVQRKNIINEPRQTKQFLGGQSAYSSFQLKFSGKESLSNMSTDRTFTQPISKDSHSVSKTIVKFNNSFSNSTLPLLPSNIKNNYSQLVSYQNQPSPSTLSYFNKAESKVHNTPQPLRSNSFFISQTIPEPKKSQFISQTIQPQGKFNFQATHSNKIFSEAIQQNKNNYESTKRQQSIKKQQRPSPILQYDYSFQKTPNKKVYEQKNLLDYKLPNISANQSGIQKVLIPEKMSSNLQNIHPIQHNTFQKNTISSMKNDNYQNDLAQKQTQTNKILKEEDLKTYRPNKEVQQILKRLGIGSLLYGNQQQNSQKSTFKTEKYNTIEPQTHKNSSASQLGLQQMKEGEVILTKTTLHQGVYKINSQNKQSSIDTDQSLTKNSIRQQNKLIESTEETPIRQPKKLKFNSTIVQVGDEDSQNSQTIRKNEDYPIDLSQHQFVVEQYETGSKYQGYKLHGQRDGQGKFFYQDGGYYEGQWKANKMHGWGKLYYEGGKLAYQGNWSHDQFHGFGKVYNDNPINLQCGFDFTNFDLLQDYWDYYEGSLVKDTKEGRGKIFLTNGEMFEGDFHNDRIQGFGKFFMKDGTIIEGIWRDSKLIKIIS